MKMTDFKENVKLQIGILLSIFVVIILVVVIGTISSRKKVEESPASTSSAEDSTIIVQKIVEKEVEKFVEVEKEITTEIIKDGLNDMGILITEEYYFTQVENYTSTKKLFTVIPLESSFVYSYDGVVAAGIDCTQIQVKKDDNRKLVTITLPKAEIRYIDIDTESFQVYSEKEGFGNKLTLEDYNTSLDEFKKAAETRAINKGIIDKADKAGEMMIRNFVNSLLASYDYSVEINYK